MPKKKDTTKVGDILVILGGLLGLLFGILTILEVAPVFLPSVNLGGFINNIVLGAIQIVISLIILATSDIIKIPQLKLEKNWIIFFILGIVLYIFGGQLAGLLVIIGAILLAL